MKNYKNYLILFSSPNVVQMTSTSKSLDVNSRCLEDPQLGTPIVFFKHFLPLIQISH